MSIEDPMGRVTALGWDAALRNTSFTLPDPDGPGGPLLAPVTTTVFDAASQPISVTDPLNRTTTTEYHPRGWVSLVVDPLGNEQGAAYDANGNMIQRTESGPNGMTPGQQGYLFDDLDRMVTYTDQLSHSTTYTFDAASRVLTKTNALGYQTSFTYTARDQVATITTPDPDGPTNPLVASVTTFGYDAALNRTTVTDALSRTTTTAFDAQNRATETTDPRTGVTQITFDLAGRRIELTDPVNNVTSWDYDNADRMISETGPLNFDRVFVYNNADELTKVTDRNGRERTFTRDNLGRVTAEQWLDAAHNPIYTISYVHDAASQLTSVSDAFSAYAFGYNDAGWLTSENNSGTPGVPNVVLTHGYNAFGERTSRSDNLGGSTTFTFDQAHRIKTAALTVGTNSAQVAWTYDNADRMTKITRNGMGSEVWTNITLDNMDRVKQIAHSSYQGQLFGQPPLNAFNYVYNAASEITSYTGPEGTLNYTHDTTSQLTGVSGARSETYSFDLNGNRTMTGYQTGTGNQLLSDGVYDYDYDNEGNLTLQTRLSDNQRTEFTWDHRNRLTKVLLRDAAGTVLKESRFTYDAFDRLIGRWNDSDGPGPQAAIQTWHAYDGDNPYADFNAAGSLTNRYLYGAAIDELLGRMSSAGVVDWYLTDLIGSVRQIVNKMGTSVLHAAVYDSFGNIASQTGTGDRFKFTGREWEEAVGKHFYRARWYDSETGRFLSEDPIGLAGGDRNPYRYAANRPTIWVDPLGLQAEEPDPDPEDKVAPIPAEDPAPAPAPDEGPIDRDPERDDRFKIGEGEVREKGLEQAEADAKKKRKGLKDDPDWEGEKKPKQAIIASKKKTQQRADYERNRPPRSNRGGFVNLTPGPANSKPPKPLSTLGAIGTSAIAPAAGSIAIDYAGQQINETTSGRFGNLFDNLVGATPTDTYHNWRRLLTSSQYRRNLLESRYITQRIK